MLEHAMETYNKFQDNPTIYEIKGGNNSLKEFVNFIKPKNAELEIKHQKDFSDNLKLNTKYIVSTFTGLSKKETKLVSKVNDPSSIPNNNTQANNQEVSIMRTGNQNGVIGELEWTSPNEEWTITGYAGMLNTKTETFEFDKSDNVKIDTHKYKETPVGLKINYNLNNRNNNLSIYAGVEVNTRGVNSENFGNKTSFNCGIKLSPVNGPNSPHRKVTKTYGRRH
jgi:hypothetical protein